MKIAKWQRRVAESRKKSTRQLSMESHLCHLHSEVSETFECLRAFPEGSDESSRRSALLCWQTVDGKLEGFPIELADVALMALYIAEIAGIDLEAMMELKIAEKESSRGRIS